jgi:hypothetical protein
VSISDLLPHFTPTALFWLAVPCLLFLGYWLAPLLTRQPKKGKWL